MTGRLRDQWPGFLIAAAVLLVIVGGTIAVIVTHN